MIEIRNRTKGPVAIICRSFAANREKVKSMTVLNIPGNKTITVADERVEEMYLQRHKKWGQIDFRYVSNNEPVNKEEK